MSDQEHERPLTRRELRLREQAEREGVDSIDELAAADDSDVSAVGGEQTEALAEGIDTSAIEIEIDPLHPDGTPRTRREMRELREAAIAAIAAEDSGDVASEAEAELETASERDGHDAAEHDSYGAPTEALSFEDLPNGDASASEEIDLDAP
uniref:hypothetical protein n=1 Tax=Leucobacter sp. BZR 635 TaxID=3378705 RepID=UPI003A864B0D